MTDIYMVPAGGGDSNARPAPSMAEQINAHNAATRDVDNGAEQVTIEALAADRALYLTECHNDNHPPKCQCGEGLGVQDVVTAVFSGNGQTTFDVITNPSHYNSDRWPCECKDFARHMTFPPGNAFKCIWRHADKSKPIEDLGKAVEYLDWAIEDNSHVFADMSVGHAHTTRRNKLIAEVDAAVEYAVERSTDLVTRSAYSALSLIVRREYRLAQSTLKIVLL